jgi:branched-chain amino acid transport system ATP-binding protein
MTDEPLLKIEGLNTYYSTSHVLHDLSLTFEKGAFSIIGRNGMGKTTLVKTIMGLVPARDGTIYFNGQDITNLKPYQIGSRGIGYVPQGRELFPSLSVEEHLIMVARDGDGEGWGPERVYELFPRLKERTNQKAASLSGGEQQMLAIARALVTNPSLLLMDEPSEGLAPVILDSLIETYHSLIESGMSIFLVEQNLHTAVSLVSEQHIMLGGEIVHVVDSDVLLHDKEAREEYLGVATRG